MILTGIMFQVTIPVVKYMYTAAVDQVKLIVYRILAIHLQ